MGRGLGDRNLHRLHDVIPQRPASGEGPGDDPELRTEQAQGAYRVAQFYEKKRRWDGARVYYNEVVSKDPNSELAAAARRRLTALRKAPAAVPPSQP